MLLDAAPLGLKNKNISDSTNIPPLCLCLCLGQTGVADMYAALDFVLHFSTKILPAMRT
ncbi:MAG: hypothetical protein PHN88_13910 [Ignavibacteria bacterium]|nr:hypothetical protein [Ignavibacteria bacterium]